MNLAELVEDTLPASSLPPPTEEQAYILGLLHNTEANLLIDALPGSGKTTMLELIQAQTNASSILCLAFNKRIAVEMEKRFLSTTTVKTFNGFGHSIWYRTQGKMVLDPKKTQNLYNAYSSTLKRSQREALSGYYWEIINAVSLAKSLGYIPDGTFPQANHLCSLDNFISALDEEPTDEVLEAINEVLVSSIKAAYAGSIDFNDQIYMPALFGGTFPRYELVLVDEGQDLSPTNHALLYKLQGSRIIAVGDPRQNINGFRGAMQGGMANLKEHFQMITATLSVSFRCPEQIVKAVHWHAPHMKWSKSGGRAVNLLNPTFASLPDDATFICRNNAPLFKMALSLLAHGRSVSVYGSDIGPKIVGILRKLGHDDTTKSELLAAIDDWLSEKLARQSTSATDIAECMRVFASYAETLRGAVNYAEHLFKQKGTILLLTGHKAKGLEWDTVYFLDPWLIGDSEQENNLRFVISTRAKSTLYVVNSKDFT